MSHKSGGPLFIFPQIRRESLEERQERLLETPQNVQSWFLKNLTYTGHAGQGAPVLLAVTVVGMKDDSKDF